MAVICFDIGGTNVKYALIKDGKIYSKNSIPTIHTSTEEFLQYMVKVIRQFERTNEIKGIALSVPGIVERETGKSITAGAVRHLYGKNLKQLLKAYFSYPIYIENDAKCALKAELTMGNAKGFKDVVLVTIGTGIGGAIAYDGKMIYGKEYKAGEFGMMRMDIGLNPDRTMHELASTSALIIDYKKKKQLPNSDLVEARVIFQEQTVDSETAEVVNAWITRLAFALFNVIVSYTPEKLLIGGGISANPLLLPMIQEELHKNPQWKDFETTIEITEFKNDAGIMGAYSFLVEESLKNSLKERLI